MNETDFLIEDVFGGPNPDDMFFGKKCKCGTYMLYKHTGGKKEYLAIELEDNARFCGNKDVAHYIQCLICNRRHGITTFKRVD